jgi:hypothetical protein
MDVVEWCRLHDIWYLKIDLEIPDACISEAQAVYDEGFFVPHRYGDGDGWESASLHGFVPDTAKDTSRDGITQKIPLVMASQKRLSSGVGQRLRKLHQRQNDG